MKKILLILLSIFVSINSYSQVLCIQCHDIKPVLNPTAINLITNGSFETTTCGAFGNYICPNSSSYSCDVLGWDCFDGGSATYAAVYGSILSPVIDGLNVVYLGNAFCNACSNFANDTSCLIHSDCEILGFPPNYPVNLAEYGGANGVSFSQTVAGLTSGSIYCLEFWSGGEASDFGGFDYPGVFGVDVGFGYNYLSCIATPPNTPPNDGRRYLITFRTNSTIHTIKFTNWGHICNTCTEVILDDVRLYPVNQAVTTLPDCVFIIDNPQSLCLDDSYTFNGTTYTFPTTEGYDTLISANGLDSIIHTIITWNFVYQVPNPQSICSGNSYSYNGHTYTQAGIYNDTLTSIFGCDSVVTTTLSVGNATTFNNPQSICIGGSYVLNGHTYTEAGTYNDTISSAGCDSVIITVLTTTNAINTNNPQSICSGSSYFINGHSYSSAGTYTDTLTASAGCDSIITTVLTLSNTVNFNNPQSICNGYSYSINGHSYSNAGTYTDTLTAAAGCDSIVTTLLTLKDCTKCKIIIPNAFSPNNDGINDILKPLGMCIENFSMTIYNRWGQKVYSFSNITEGWDGLYKNIPQAIGIYVYVASGNFDNGETFKLKGNISLIR